MADAVLVGVHSLKTADRVRTAVVHSFQLKTADKTRSAVNVTFDPVVIQNLYGGSGSSGPTDPQSWTDS